MKTLTTSELNQILISKNYGQYQIYNLPKNKWGADYFSFIECKDGYSAIQLCIHISENLSKCILKYNKMKAADKKEFASLVLGY